jgi:general stress protein YciG
VSDGLKRRGFGGMDPEKRREIASRAGKASHASGRAHRWTSEEASEAGKKGGAVMHAKRRAKVGA